MDYFTEITQENYNTFKKFINEGCGCIDEEYAVQSFEGLFGCEPLSEGAQEFLFFNLRKDSLSQFKMQLLPIQNK